MKTKLYQAWTRNIKKAGEMQDQYVTTYYRCENKQAFLDYQKTQDREIQGGQKGVRLAPNQNQA